MQLRLCVTVCHLGDQDRHGGGEDGVVRVLVSHLEPGYPEPVRVGQRQSLPVDVAVDCKVVTMDALVAPDGSSVVLGMLGEQRPGDQSGQVAAVLSAR